MLAAIILGFVFSLNVLNKYNLLSSVQQLTSAKIKIKNIFALISFKVSCIMHFVAYQSLKILLQSYSK